MIKTKVALYCRESSKNTNLAPPVEEQIELGKNWAEANNFELMHVFVDNGYSGGDWNRPDWLKSIKEAKRHSYKLLWTFSQDRLARDTEQFLWYYRNLKTLNVKIFDHCLQNFIDMDSLGGRVQHTALAQASEIFRLVTAEKVRAKYQALKDKGVLRWGRPKANFDIDKAIELRNKGLGYRMIGKELNANYQTIRRALQNRVFSNSDKNENS